MKIHDDVWMNILKIMAWATTLIVVGMATLVFSIFDSSPLIFSNLLADAAIVMGMIIMTISVFWNIFLLIKMEAPNDPLHGD